LDRFPNLDTPQLRNRRGPRHPQPGGPLPGRRQQLGHERPTTTHRYIEADLAVTRRALAALAEPGQRKARFRPSDQVLAFLEGL